MPKASGMPYFSPAALADSALLALSARSSNTETAHRWYGYIEGAIRSGERAANEVHHATSPV